LITVKQDNGTLNTTEQPSLPQTIRILVSDIYNIGIHTLYSTCMG